MKKKQPSLNVQVIDDTLDHLDFKPKKPATLTKLALKKVFREGETATLTKINMNKFSMVPPGYSCTGLLKINRYKGLTVSSESNMNDWLTTSAVKRIVKATKKSVVFETQTSTYQLDYVKASK